LVRTLTSELALLKDELYLTDDDFPQFLVEERSYLTSLKQLPQEEAIKLRYVQALEDLEEKKYVLFCGTSYIAYVLMSRAEWIAACAAVNTALSTVHPRDLSATRSALNRVHIHVDLAYTKLQNAQVLVAHLQQQLGLESAWEVGSAEYNRFKEEATLAKYREALSELEQLVVMHLFELSKISMSSTGMYVIFPSLAVTLIYV
jgi:hypothetical protein